MFGSQSMQALSSSSKLLPLDSESACQNTAENMLRVVDEKRLLPLNEVNRRRPANQGFNQESQIIKATDSESPSSEKSKSTKSKVRGGSCQDKTLSKTGIPSFDYSRAELLFPDFFPREKVLCYHQGCLIPLAFQADPVLSSWMNLFGLQMVK